MFVGYNLGVLESLEIGEDKDEVNGLSSLFSLFNLKVVISKKRKHLDKNM